MNIIFRHYCSTPKKSFFLTLTTAEPEPDEATERIGRAVRPTVRLQPDAKFGDEPVGGTERSSEKNLRHLVTFESVVLDGENLSQKWMSSFRGKSKPLKLAPKHSSR
jgi:hypothetical protein